MTDCGRLSPWSLAGYRGLLEALAAGGYQTTPIARYLKSPSPRPAILRHDIDRFPGNALAMARLEAGSGVRSTYYVRMKPRIFSPALVTSLADLGHEVGLHYETLSDADGDRQRAAELFQSQLELLRRYVPVATAAAHGSPLSRWDNRDLWAQRAPEEFGLEAEVYRDLDMTGLAYFTDTGRRWDAQRTNLRDRYPGSSQAPAVDSGQALAGLLAQGFLNGVYLQTHPERWCHSLATLARSAAWDAAANGAKLVLRAVRHTRGQG